MTAPVGTFWQLSFSATDIAKCIISAERIMPLTIRKRGCDPGAKRERKSMLIIGGSKRERPPTRRDGG